MNEYPNTFTQIHNRGSLSLTLYIIKANNLAMSKKLKIAKTLDDSKTVVPFLFTRDGKI